MYRNPAARVANLARTVGDLGYRVASLDALSRQGPPAAAAGTATTPRPAIPGRDDQPANPEAPAFLNAADLFKTTVAGVTWFRHPDGDGLRVDAIGAEGEILGGCDPRRHVIVRMDRRIPDRHIETGDKRNPRQFVRGGVETVFLRCSKWPWSMVERLQQRKPRPAPQRIEHPGRVRDGAKVALTGPTAFPTWAKVERQGQ